MIPSTFPQLGSSPIRLSQGHLNLLATCPRKFQYAFLDQLSSPNSTEQQERQTQGAQFHLLLQQWQLGLPIAPLTQADPQLDQWFKAFEAASSEILALPDSDSASIQQAEHERTLESQGYLLTMRYDLLLSGDRQSKILDWKTYPRPQNARHLAENWQTRLYLYGLAETSPYDPEQLSMVYWFFQGTQDDAMPQSLRFSYDRTQHNHTHQDLTQILQQLTDWLNQYADGESLPQLGPVNRECDRCNFFPRCFGGDSLERSALRHRAQPDQSPLKPADPLTLLEISKIQEVPL
ncbi:PD-(D/E)XK nuclease family protein [Phormidium sp. CLA17]|uniref:PD-(D/E)XK nuclease family protein n=1 Tax=Leptolyngbya sp. Cla-17 TaxID=2803751 RepID=UPI0014927F3B|nr:PD-(D/E)XK nuclease family protein [Leptolyngbya sp. Cla-17]MBM0740460.1 PD-(D/E)XK nuclease family protein [Leptolyngbya sp. Cla-17]